MRRRGTTILSLLALAGTLTACADPEPTVHEDTRSLATAAREAMVEAGTTRLEFSFATGEESANTGRCLTTVSEPESRQADDDPTAETAEHDFDCVFATQGGETRFIVAGGYLYVEVPEDQQEPDQRPWVRTDPYGADPIAQQFAGLHQQAARSASLADILPATADITAAEPDEVDGVAAQRYELSVDVAEAIEAGTDESVTAAQESLLAAGVTTIEGTVWLDADDLPIRQVVEFEMPEAGTVRTETDFSLWGEAHEVLAPPDHQVAERVPAG
ncbi:MULTISPECIES: hypothetical protein [Actinoalloteichus]|uniref:Lipoprotein n=1 Tax=Actinoalloteichus fjordicus TaxID=1612552 RepID=A0AAC9PUU0_9PSEU|nr:MULTISPECIES: hypothetical protein [Actinoalloteichus]APU17301.1 hypothetical protein UA74_26480 [Actinoalloteichus fjordicus]APU23384.1 hypothetical protein UA75_27065 [Actinoalloteichus sp. GBA129-24]